MIKNRLLKTNISINRPFLMSLYQIFELILTKFGFVYVKHYVEMSF